MGRRKNIFTLKGIGVTLSLLALALMPLGITSYPTYAVPQTYSYDTSAITLYDYEPLGYDFTGLDSGTQYTFTLQALTDTGSVAATLDSVLVGPGVTIGTVFFGNSYGSWPIGSRFPMQVIDQFGQVLSKHYLSPDTHDDWQLDGTVLDGNKQGIGGVVHNPVNGYGYQHDEDLYPIPASVYTTSGGFGLDTTFPLYSIVALDDDYTLLHYHLNGATSSDKITITDIGTDTVVAEFKVEDLICYSQFDGGATFAARDYSFLPLNTSGISKGFYDDGFISTCFDDSTSPNTLNLPPSAYSYGRVDSLDVVQDEGESVFIVTVDSGLTEWDVDVQTNPLTEGKEQRIYRRQKSSASHAGFPNQIIYDLSTTLDTVDYAFDDYRHSRYNITYIANDIIYWEVESSDLHYGQTASEFPLYVTTSFSMVAAAAPIAPTDRLKNLILDHNLDTPIGILSIFLIVIIGLFYGLMKMQSSPLLYLLAYLATTGMFIALNLFPAGLRELMGLMAFASLLLFMIFGRGKEALD